MHSARARKLLRVVRSERRELARLRPILGARRAVAERVRDRLDLQDATESVARLESSVQLLTDELVGTQECLTRLDRQLQFLTEVSARDAERVLHLERTCVSEAALVDRQRDASRVQDILATTTWVERLPPSDVLVSIILPTHNRPELLREAIDSVLQQSHRNFELVIVDDASRPETGAVLDGYDDPRIRWFRREQNGGGGAARNIGLAQARGEYITYLDDDNLIGRLWLRAVIWSFESNPSAEIAYGAMVNDLRTNPDELPFFALIPWDRQRLVLSNFIDQGTIAHRADLRAVYDETSVEAGDWDFMVRMTEDRDALRIPVVAVHYRTRHEGRISDQQQTRTEVGRMQQRFARRGPLRILVLDDLGTAAPGASPVAAGETLRALGDRVTTHSAPGVVDGESADAGVARLRAAIRSERPDIVLTTADPATEAQLLAAFTPYVAFAVDGTGESPDRPTVSLGQWDAREPFGFADDGGTMRSAMLRRLDLMRAAWLGLPQPDRLPDDVLFSVVDTRDEPGLVTMVRDGAVPTT